MNKCHLVICKASRTAQMILENVWYNVQIMLRCLNRDWLRNNSLKSIFSQNPDTFCNGTEPCIDNLKKRQIDISRKLVRFIHFSSRVNKVRCLPSSITFFLLASSLRLHRDWGFSSENQLRLMFPSRYHGHSCFKESRHQENIKSSRWKTIHKWWRYFSPPFPRLRVRLITSVLSINTWEITAGGRC